MQAWFDVWERFHDYTVMRRDTGRSPEQPVWLLFHEAEEMHVDNPTQLVRHMGADLRHDLLIRQYYEGAPGQFYEVGADDLIDDRWAIRVCARTFGCRRCAVNFIRCASARPSRISGPRTDPRRTASRT